MRDPIMQFFTYAHLPEPLQRVSRVFCDLAEHIHADVPRNPERTVALRKLLEAKDAAVRASIYISAAPGA
jgi:hypothetical protein